MSKCVCCSRELLQYEIGLHKKMINRGATEFMCLSCLSSYFNCSEELLLKKLEHFRNMGCMLFASEDNG